MKRRTSRWCWAARRTMRMRCLEPVDDRLLLLARALARRGASRSRAISSASR